jgi:KUP system potassium uptake protein
MSTSAAAVSTPAAAEHKARPALLVGALGVVFGDIGTSPIYAFRESLRAAGGAAAQATVLGTAATVIASQAVISGAFALVQQAIQLGAVPRLEVRQTSDESAGQVYLPH